MSKTNRKQDALDYHSQGRPGKIQVVPTKPYSSQRDLTLAYSPGVAEPCLKIAENKDDSLAIKWLHKAYQKLDNLSIYKTSVTGIVRKNINQVGHSGFIMPIIEKMLFH